MTTLAHPKYATLIAERSTQAPEGQPQKPRWTSMRVFYLYAPPPSARGRRWLTLLTGHSSLPGETDREQSSLRTTLEDSMRLIRPSPIGDDVKQDARNWLLANSAKVMMGIVNGEGQATDDLRWAIEVAGRMIEAKDGTVLSDAESNAIRMLVEHVEVSIGSGETVDA
jgi:hypothetical protein